MAPVTVGVIGAGSSGLLHPGGVWTTERVYPGLFINNVHGEFRFSPLEMPPPENEEGRLTGDDMRMYMETFASRYLTDKIRYRTEVVRMQLSDDSSGGWIVTVRHLESFITEDLKYDKVVLCTGGCSEPKIPGDLCPKVAQSAGFAGPVFHSSGFREKRDEVLRAASRDCEGYVLVVGGGKSAQDISAYLAKQGIQVCMVFTTTDAVLAAPTPYPPFIRKSRFLSVLSPHVELRTRLERFLHTTWLGKQVVHAIWAFLTRAACLVLAVPTESPLRLAPSLFWTVRTNDEGTGRKDVFHALVKRGHIGLIAPCRAVRYAGDGKSVVLSNGGTVKASAVVLATGFKSSWNSILDEHTRGSLGFVHRCDRRASYAGKWNYATLPVPPPAPHTLNTTIPLLYRGIVPAANILQRNIAANGAMFTTNNGYVYEIAAHWISSYFLADVFLHLPSSTEVIAHTERHTAWLQESYPNALLYANESYSSDVAFWSWPQLTDPLLEDMQLRSMRSGGNNFTWPFRVIDLEEIKDVTEERAALRLMSSKEC